MGPGLGKGAVTDRITKAAIDVGTISVRLLVAEVSGTEIRPLARRAEVTRLGQGVGVRGKLATAARRRTAEVVGRFVAEARALGANELIVAGTSAAREAADGEEFLQELGKIHAVATVVLPGSQEAELAYAGVSSDLKGDLVVLDIGGGSTELITRDAGGSLRSASLALGANRATERWLHSDPPTYEEISGAYAEAQAVFARVVQEFGASKPRDFSPSLSVCVPEAWSGTSASSPGLTDQIWGGEGYTSEPVLVGVAGTVVTLASLEAGLKQYDPDVIHHRRLSRKSVSKLLDMLAALNTRRRAALPCVQRGRAAVLPGGAIVLLAAMDTLGYEELLVSERDLLEGLVLWGAK